MTLDDLVSTAKLPHIGAALAVCLAIHLTACSEPSIGVQFQIPADYRSEVESAVLRVLEPTGPESFGCDDVAFDRITEDTRQASLRQEVAVRAGTSLDLVGIPRLGDKLFWVQGLDADNQPVLAGCQAFGEITGQASVTVIGEPTTVVTTDLLSPVGAPLPDNVELFVTDTRGQPLDDVDIEWTLVTASDPWQTGMGRTRAGVVEVTPPRPAVAGPALLDIRARWQQVALPPISGFEPVEPILQVGLPGIGDGQGTSRTDALYTVGPIGPAGQMGFAALGPVGQTDNQRQVLFGYHDESADPPFRLVTSDAINNLAVFASIARMSRGVRDAVVVSSGALSYEVRPDGQVVALGTMGGPSNVVKKLLQAGSCERDSDMLLATVAPLGGGDDTLIAIDAQGDPVASPFTAAAPSIAPLGAGCISGIDDQLYRTAVFHAEGPVRPFVADIDGPRLGEVVSFAGSVGFIRKIGESPAALLGVSIDIDGASIARYQLALGAQNELEPLLIAEDPSLTFVRAMGGGDIDGDERPDVAALLDFGLDDQLRNRTRLQLVMGTEYLGQRLLGVSQELAGTDPQLSLADFDGDGTDDLLLVDRESVTILPGLGATVTISGSRFWP